MKAKVLATRAVLVQPLCIGIHKQLEDKFPQPGLSRALGLYTGNVGYLHGLKEGVARIGLDGQPTEQLVTADEAQHARGEIDAYHAKQKRRKQAAKQPPPPSTPKRDGLASLKLAAQKRKDAGRQHAS
jgi:sRNA-binding protein